MVGQDFNPALQQLLDDELTSDPTTTRGLTNHLPMALVAKERLGADADEPDVSPRCIPGASPRWTSPVPVWRRRRGTRPSVNTPPRPIFVTISFDA